MICRNFHRFEKRQPHSRILKNFIESPDRHEIREALIEPLGVPPTRADKASEPGLGQFVENQTHAIPELCFAGARFKHPLFGIQGRRRALGRFL